MRIIRGGTANPERAVPIPDGWKFNTEFTQLQLAVGRQELPKYKLLFDQWVF